MNDFFIMVIFILGMIIVGEVTMLTFKLLTYIGEIVEKILDERIELIW